MPLIQIVIVLIVIGVLRWLVILIPMQGTIKSILNAVPATHPRRFLKIPRLD
jgi:hypothetical protein